MKRNITLVVIVIALVGEFVYLWGQSDYSQNGDGGPIACTAEAKLCSDGTSVGRSGPNCEFTKCPTPHSSTKDDLIGVDQPLAGATVTSPLVVRGEARGSWYFEGSFPIVVTNWDGLIIGQGHATADGEWMTNDYVPFTGTIEFNTASTSPYNRGSVIFKKDNPSGLPQNDNALEVPVVF